jgi:hypothetical protein
MWCRALAASAERQMACIVRHGTEEHDSKAESGLSVHGCLDAWSLCLRILALCVHLQQNATSTASSQQLRKDWRHTCQSKFYQIPCEGVTRASTHDHGQGGSQLLESCPCPNRHVGRPTSQQVFKSLQLPTEPAAYTLYATTSVQADATIIDRTRAGSRMTSYSFQPKHPLKRRKGTSAAGKQRHGGSLQAQSRMACGEHPHGVRHSCQGSP